VVGVNIKLANDTNYLKSAGYTIIQEGEIFDAVLEDIYLNSRWYLDNLQYIPEFRVRWQNYRYKGTVPYKLVKPKAL